MRREEEKGSLKPEVLVGQLSPQQWVWDGPSWPPGRTVGGQVSSGEPAVVSELAVGVVLGVAVFGQS